VTNPRHHPSRSRGRRLLFAPDPSSQIACTIGGNVAEIFRRRIALKYAFTTTIPGVNVHPARWRDLSNWAGKAPGGWLALMADTGSEGLFGMVVASPSVRILRISPRQQPQHLIGCIATVVWPMRGPAFAPSSPRHRAAAMEFHGRPRSEAVEAYPAPAIRGGSDLIILSADRRGSVGDRLTPSSAICRHSKRRAGAVSEATDEGGAGHSGGRKASFSAMGRLAPRLICRTATIFPPALSRRCWTRSAPLSAPPRSCRSVMFFICRRGTFIPP